MALTRPRAEQIYNLDYKQATRVVTIVDITLAGGAPNNVDGVNLTLGDRVLVTAQATASQNGIYDVYTLGTGSNGTWVRTSDANSTGEIEAGMIIMVTEGVVFADTQWKLITDNPIVIDTTGLTFTQNYQANSISSGSSNVVVSANANVTISSSGVANVLTVSPNGVSILGNVTANFYYGDGSHLSNINAGNISGAYGNANVYQFLQSGNSVSISTTGNISTTANILAGNISVSGNIIGNVSFDQSISVTGNIIANSVNANLYGATVSVTGNILAGNISITGNIQAGNLSVSYITGTLLTPAQPNITSVGTLTGLTTSGTVVANAISIANNATIGGNLTISGNVSILGNISSVTGNSAQFFGNTTTGFGALYAGILNGYLTEPQSTVQSTADFNGYAGILNGQNINPGQNASTDIFLSPDNGTYNDGFLDLGIASSTYNYAGYALLKPNDAYLYVAGNANTGGGNLVLGTYLSNDIVFATGGLDTVNQVMRITSANVVNVMSTVVATSTTTGALVVGGGVGVAGDIYAGGLFSATGNITGNYFIGNGSQLTGINYSNLVGAYSNANVAAYLPTYSGNLTAGNVSVSGNATAGNVLTTGQISATGDVTGNNFFMYGSGNILGNLNVQGNITFIDSNVIVTNDLYIDLANNQSTYANINGAGLNAGNSGTGPLTTWTYNTAANAWTTNVGISATANIVGGNILTAGQISAAGDVTGGNISGSGNVIAGNIFTAGNVSATGNITGNYFIGNGSQLTGVSNYANANVAAYLASYTGNISAGNVSVTGNVKATYFLGNGSQLTGVSNYANATVVAYAEAGWAGNIVPALDATYSLGNATNTWKELWVSGNSVMIGGGNLSVSNGNLLFNGNTIPVQQGANLSITGAITSATVSTSGNIYSNVNVSAVGNVVAGNILTDGIISAHGNVTTDGYFLGTFIGNISGNVTVPGLNTQVIYNNQGHAGASAGLTFNDISNTVTVSNTVAVANTVSVGGNVISNNVVVGGQVDWVSGGTSAVYQIYNSSTGSLDTIFG